VRSIKPDLSLDSDARDGSSVKRTWLWLVPLIALGALVGHFWLESRRPAPQPPAAPAPAAKPEIRHPVKPVEASENPLPPLAESDGALREGLTTLLGNELPEFVYLKDIVARIVVTLDNLPRDYVALRLMPVKPVSGLPITTKSGGNLVLSESNAERYQHYVRLVEAIPTSASIALYARFYPLFQEQYENLGYPDKYFNDRVVEVIDHLLATPEIEEPPRLIQPRVLYEFADPKLQELSAGQKILLRMGPANQHKLKAKLREMRDGLIAMKP
jgi:Protein of unknown function (DUF3014)